MEQMRKALDNVKSSDAPLQAFEVSGPCFFVSELFDVIIAGSPDA